MIHKLRQKHTWFENTDWVMCDSKIRKDYRNIKPDAPIEALLRNGQLTYNWKNVTCPKCLNKKRKEYPLTKEVSNEND